MRTVERRRDGGEEGGGDGAVYRNRKINRGKRVKNLGVRGRASENGRWVTEGRERHANGSV